MVWDNIFETKNKNVDLNLESDLLTAEAKSPPCMVEHDIPPFVNPAKNANNI